MNKAYEKFLQSKSKKQVGTPIRYPDSFNKHLFPFQEAIIKWALRRGRAAMFCDCGLGKTLMQLEWARCVPGPVLILAPLAVAQQTIRESVKFGIECEYARQDTGKTGITVANYEMLERFETSRYSGIVLDESSILKSYDGKTKAKIIDAFDSTQYRLACTATPAPNDYLELGNHSEFLGAMDRWAMRTMFFVHDSLLHGSGQASGDVRNYRLKGHAEESFWKWVASWAILVRTPSDIGFGDEGFVLPGLHYAELEIEAEDVTAGFLFPMAASTLQERIRARRDTTDQRVMACAELVNSNNEQWIVWCGLNRESVAVTKAVPGSIEVTGSDSIDHKEKTLLAFAAEEVRVLVTKPLIAGFGMNFQSCHHVAFLGLSDSWESYYQAVRRCWRFGQKSEVNVHVITSSIEGKVVANIKRKEKAADRMHEEITKHVAHYTKEELEGAVAPNKPMKIDLAEGKDWRLYLGDSVEVLKRLDDDSVDYSVFSPPFQSLFTFSDAPNDISNCSDAEEFDFHISLVYKELLRATKPGRLVSIHTSDIPRTQNFDGYQGMRDLRGEMIRLMESTGFHYHCGVTIGKNPVVEMQRTKSIGLLYKQLKKDSTRSRMGTADHISTMRKPGVNAVPVEQQPDNFPLERWQRWASPVWDDIVRGDTLTKTGAREAKDEKHVCPLQLDVIKRCIILWSNRGDLVLSPFAGIGSEGYVALQCGRRFLGVELKESYWKQAVANVGRARQQAGELFADVGKEG